MHGLVSLLPSPYYEQVEEIWKELERDYNLRGIHVTPIPHFSWQIAEDYDLDALEAAISAICATTAPILVQTTGLAMFSGSNPVLYIPVVKDQTLITLHDRIWEATLEVSLGASPYYNPSSWIPHISLAYEDVKQEIIGKVVENLAFRTFNWQMTIDNIALIYEPDGEIGTLKFRHTFGQTV